MENGGWVKYYRKILHNKELFRGSTMFPVFSLLLLMSNSDGVIVTGRDFIAKKLHLKSSAVYKAINRLKTFHILDTKSDNKGTVITILNWSKYQQQSNSKVTTKEQQSNTSIRIENKNNTGDTPAITSKEGLIACTDDELQAVASSLQVSLKDTKLVHQQILDSIADGTFQSKRYGRTVYFTLRKWIGMRISDGKLKVTNSVPAGYRPYKPHATSN